MYWRFLLAPIVAFFVAELIQWFRYTFEFKTLKLKPTPEWGFERREKPVPYFSVLRKVFRERRESVSRLEQLVEQRARAAHSTHEIINILTTGLRWELDLAKIALEENNYREIGKSLDRASQALQYAIVDLKQLLDELNTDLREKVNLMGLKGAILQRAEMLASGRIRCVFIGECEHLPPDTRDLIFKIAAEGMSNIVKHTNILDDRKIEGVVTLVISERDAVLKVQDNGSGFDVASTLASNHTVGLRLMKQLVDSHRFQSTLNILSSPKIGTTIELSVLLKK
jgi:signal transduction histidine kinase